MSSLHTISKSWHQVSWLYELLAFASEGDAVLLLGDAVQCVDSPITLASFVAKCKVQGIAVYVLQSDMQVRGVGEPISGINRIDDTGFVDLVVEHQQQVAW
ncbi:hypothetical protein GCM10008090_16190 [Arenicella chitinivorans]|uniref:Sulfurtransferase complex subunit TusB n=1 Tax=Arenicella chitinivorans TaxID=1329800 RepID=A0A918VLJ8_9GAMM|nr:sulfurtransferase complex subunit TusB [Arenicella chitinivorans]GHA07177.1 hypothetical protein GCM10008090_16190 [Arenicella chitinivorans]